MVLKWELNYLLVHIFTTAEKTNSIYFLEFGRLAFVIKN